MFAPATLSMVAKEMQLLQETTLTLSDLLDSEQSMPSVSNTEELKLEQNFLEETGFGLPSGCFQPMLNMEPGPLQEKLISWNQEEMMHHILLEESINMVPLSTGDQTGLKTNTCLLTKNSPTLVA